MSEKFMLRALELSRNALPNCLPNPPVGCVLVKNGYVVAEGYTQSVGGNHAEVEALNSYNGSMEGVTAYVTLEPCSFVGRTPACANTLINSGIKSVVVAMLDPDVRNNGQGIEILERVGINVQVGFCEAQVRAFLEPYLGKS
ncbi:TPA: bifunctional diaminohydroxyphosphoribosylaminopyrimidine deaminase/5-amino-6-(5-phosphoribosylamino)uracil reductase RibD [Vibrio parahaemolyticus]|uniref:bifunctional diaminohydroxyphosphoribosylaminopyrimidine deaminase/5-amino-6-(5-phosphoribosylamino)uracil reductase RibD n=1 Tax=Vibrio parahaemolyticus TaxID=670 RepID=UPI0004710838|nr:bifunctional diaminohydroxyphosphoribosylaminopyrimidine deaminase/5-amino-6-(5-phosphoribosylamino)uracil reductase RibD [Vibrio parahaemolyticus]EHH1174004.1 riboflavin-specific deaminase [Vibrio parahaemolyticus]ELA9815267.1 bifunctional diaminohydroxyphosphoribosylaminopyrimidine deaminase/5-amino-6-(5-phosphoribosylamino)uracil reductase RibD [Vibrio parahaemolyticus]ELA9890051.1 bifunctional diaminohydroxyphosphoribosylaminopyrimidine deaminase/5-amino-6-(5-phosphoribosylamino)uracil re